MIAVRHFASRKVKIFLVFCSKKVENQIINRLGRQSEGRLEKCVVHIAVEKAEKAQLSIRQPDIKRTR